MNSLLLRHLIIFYKVNKLIIGISKFILIELLTASYR